MSSQVQSLKVLSMWLHTTHNTQHTMRGARARTHTHTHTPTFTSTTGRRGLEASKDETKPPALLRMWLKLQTFGLQALVDLLCLRPNGMQNPPLAET